MFSRPPSVPLAGLRTQALDRPANGDPVGTDLSGDDFDTTAIVQFDRGNVLGRYVSVMGRFHFFCRWQVDPKLEAVHQAVCLLWHFRVNDASPSGHPLHVATF